MGYQIGHINFTFYTEVPGTLKEWFNQRIVWFAGGVRHHIINVGSFGWYHFFIFFYNSLIVYLLMPLRWVEIINYPWTMFVLIVLSWIYISIICYGKGWRKEFLLLPFYSLAQSMVILPIAIVRYFKYAWRQKSLGILHYDLSRFNTALKMLFSVLNISTATFVIYIAADITDIRFHYWYIHGTLFKTVLSIL